MNIPSPYLVYLGAATDPLSIKTSRGVAEWRRELCVGQRRLPGCEISLGLDDLTYEQAVKRGAKTLILGEANSGGILSEVSAREAIAALEAGLNVASGLHQRLSQRADIREAAQRTGRSLFDVREPPPNLPIGTGRPRAGYRLLTVGTDCSIGKMYSSLALERELRQRGYRADFRATGQTGILVAGSGVPIDAVIADFIAGAAEWLSPDRHDGGWDIIEGQGSLFHPSFAGVSLGLLHGSQPNALVMCHETGRTHMRGLSDRALPPLKECLQANLEAARLTQPNVVMIGVALNTSKLDRAEARRQCEMIENEVQLPCEDPIAMGATKLVGRLLECFPDSQLASNAGR
ncbi:MAG: N-acetyltransferase DgcN [Steroidobacter sp.]